ncbi:3-phosphoshikimate 1-carboxyvinyltransferase [bacterium]|nr:3-phosphoshikimate 1-carboxyvinyltransferase [bacterium]
MSSLPSSPGEKTTARIEPARGPLRGRLSVPGDKSISHRALLFGALAEGEQIVTGLAPGADVASTRSVLEALGARIERRDGGLVVRGDGALSLRASRQPLDCGNSGTTMRLMAGALAGLGIEATLVGDASLSRRPMERVAAPLRAMGARIETTDGHAPLKMSKTGKLRGIVHRSEVASAQVKSCVLLAGLRAEGETTVQEPERSRDHTERLLTSMGVSLDDATRGRVSLKGGQALSAVRVEVPGDLSSAAFPIVAALLVRGSDVEVEGVGLNPTRTGFLEVLDMMGAEVELGIEGASGGEPLGRVRARGSRDLEPVTVSGDVVVRAIEELPALFALAAFAKGRSTFRNAQELRKKESDRIAAMARGLRALGVECEELEDGLAVVGDPGRALAGGVTVESEDDHRIAMALACAALRSRDAVLVAGASAVQISYPGFFEDLDDLRGEERP